ncbi:MAG: tetratricopeptide repeat protein [Phycisphaerae bacterium]
MTTQIEQAEALFAQGQTDQARQQLTALLAEEPDSSRILNDLGVIAFAEQDIRTAESLFNRAAQADPDNQQSLRNLVDLHQSQQNWPQAAAALLELRNKIGDCPDLLNELAVMLLEMQNVAGATEALKRSLELKPDQPEVRTSLEAIGKLPGPAQAN